MYSKSLTAVAVLSFFALVATGCTPKPQADTTTLTTNSIVLNDPVVTLDDEAELNQESLPVETSPNAQKEPVNTVRTPDEFKEIQAKTAVLDTSKGEITIELYPDRAPITVQNFLNLIDQGFYDGMVFHRVIENFMAQVGDPNSKDPSLEPRWGTGGPGYSIPDEFHPELKHDSAGILSMANSGPNTGGSQIFITFEPTPWLDGKHAVFGKVTDGLDVLLSIEKYDVINSARFE